MKKYQAMKFKLENTEHGCQMTVLDCPMLKANTDILEVEFRGGTITKVTAVTEVPDNGGTAGGES